MTNVDIAGWIATIITLIYTCRFTLTDLQELFEKIRVESVVVYDDNVIDHFFKLVDLWLDSISPQLVYYRFHFPGAVCALVILGQFWIYRRKK
jgi:hypothetical protein